MIKITGYILKTKRGYEKIEHAGNSWIAKNLPAYKTESYINSPENYISSVKWNGVISKFTSEQSLDIILRNKTGNSADINMMLILLLRKLGYEAHPVLISTRENGIMSFGPALFKPNYVICCVKVDGSEILMDATDPLLPYNLLPERAINQHGQLVGPRISKQVMVPPTGTYINIMVVEAKINEDFSIKGNLVYRKKDYATYELRKDYLLSNSKEEFIDNFCHDKQGLTIKKSSFENIDNKYEITTETYEFELSDAIDVFDKDIYFQPILFEKTEKKPFNDYARESPVDFMVPFSKVYIMNYTLPEKVKVTKLPDPAKLNLPDQKGNIVYAANLKENTIQVTLKYTIMGPIFYTHEYPYLTEYYTQLINKQNEQTVLKETEN